MTFEVTAPSAGGVKIELNLAEAEILLRLIDVTNYGSMQYSAPTLLALGDELRELLGVNGPSSCTNTYSKVSGGQVHIYEKHPF